MFTRFSSNIKAILLAVLGYGCFSIADTSVKWLSAYYSVFQIITIETAIASLMMLALAPWLGGFSLKNENIKIHGLRMVLNFAINVLIVYALAKLPMTTVYTFVFTKPFLVTLLGILFYHQIVSKKRWVIIATGFIGILIALQPGTDGFNVLFLVPLAASLFISLLFIVSRSLEKASMFSLGFFPVFGSFILTFPLMISDYTPLDFSHLPLFLLATVTSVSGIITLSVAYRIADASLISPFLYLQMIWGAILGYLIFNDLPGISIMVGSAIIIASGIYLIESERRLRHNAGQDQIHL